MFGNNQLKEALIKQGGFVDPSCIHEPSKDLIDRVKAQLSYDRAAKEVNDLVAHIDCENFTEEHLRALLEGMDSTDVYSDVGSKGEWHYTKVEFLERLLKERADLAEVYGVISKMDRNELTSSATRAEVTVYKYWLVDTTVFEYKLIRALVAISQYGEELGQYPGNADRTLWLPVNTKNLKKLSDSARTPTLAISKDMHSELTLLSRHTNELFTLLKRLKENQFKAACPDTGKTISMDYEILERIGNRIILTFGPLSMNTGMEARSNNKWFWIQKYSTMAFMFDKPCNERKVIPA